APDDRRLNMEIIKRSDQGKGFIVLPKRWVIERTFAWFGRCRQLTKDWECLSRMARAFLLLTSIRLMLRRLGRVTGRSRSASEVHHALSTWWIISAGLCR